MIKILSVVGVAVLASADPDAGAWYGPYGYSNWGYQPVMMGYSDWNNWNMNNWNMNDNSWNQYRSYGKRSADAEAEAEADPQFGRRNINQNGPQNNAFNVPQGDFNFNNPGAFNGPNNGPANFNNPSAFNGPNNGPANFNNPGPGNDFRNFNGPQNNAFNPSGPQGDFNPTGPQGSNFGDFNTAFGGPQQGPNSPFRNSNGPQGDFNNFSGPQ